jgi:uracil-DNA glycosylase family protein
MVLHGHSSAMTRSSDSENGWSAEPFVPRSRSLRTLERAVQTCRGCPLFADTTQAVFGEGSTGAPLVLVGEQPGDHEDKLGRPFVGPAGRELWRCLDAAGIERSAVFVTNAVKHFKHEHRGRRRLHQKPNAAEIEACHPWVDAELRAVDARVVVALGASAARSLFGRTMPIAANRGTTLQLDGRPAIVTYHPSAILRADAAAEQVREALIDDLRSAKRLADIAS